MSVGNGFSAALGSPRHPRSPSFPLPRRQCSEGQATLARQARQAARQNLRRHLHGLRSDEHAIEVSLQARGRMRNPHGGIDHRHPGPHGRIGRSRRERRVSVRVRGLRRSVECAGRTARYLRSKCVLGALLVRLERKRACLSRRQEADADDPLSVGPSDLARRGNRVSNLARAADESFSLAGDFSWRGRAKL